MTISDTQKVDYLWKKIGYGVTKTDVSSILDATNEPFASPLQIRGDKVWQQSSNIANVIPGSNTSIVTVFTTSAPVQCFTDTGASTNRTWETGISWWIPPEFGSTYQVKVYISPTNQPANVLTKGTQVFATGSGNNDEWFFDYQSGILNFIGTNLPPTSFTGNTVYISGAVYSGNLGLPTQTSLGNITFNGQTISTSVANANIIIVANGNGIVQLGGNIAFGMPVGTNATRPIIPSIGYTRFNTDLDSIEYFDGNAWLIPGVTTISSDTIYPDGTSNVYVLSSNNTSTGVMVSINGTIQQPITAYTVSNNQIAFTEIPLTTDVIEVRHLAKSAQTQSFGTSDVAAFLPTYYGNIGNVNLSTFLPNVAAVIALRGNVTTLESNIVTINNTLATLTANAGSQANDITVLYSNAASQSGLIAGLLSNVGTATTNITTLFANASAQSGDISTLYANAALQSGNIATIFSNIAATAGTLTILTANAASQAGDISTIYANLASKTGIISNLTGYANANVAAYLVSNDITIGGNLTVTGVTTTVNREIVNQAEVIAGNLVANSTAQSVNTLTGALVVAGGAGIAGNVYAGNLSATYLTGTLLTASQPNITTVGNLTALAVTGVTSYVGIVYANSNVSSANISTGALVVLGGVGISGNLNVGAGLSLGANLNVSGNIIANGAIYSDRHLYANGLSILSDLYANAAQQSANIASLKAAVESGYTTSYETLTKNLNAYPYAINRSGTTITSVVYTSPGGTITKLFNYSSGLLISVAIFGSTLGHVYTKNLSYSGTSITGASYSVL